jgi:hypothetical protein
MTWKELCAEPGRVKLIDPGDKSGTREVFRFINEADFDRIVAEAKLECALAKPAPEPTLPA